ncbi:MAG: phosphatase PAP2 family protein [Bacteroidota bacterium]|nr:phosphatase PAP2 family protein [Bacteroidota bacterium]MDP4230909.1 phosphatase PAP2 family protein [Bacteroidota bacterium]MDP4235981.1 phosphatase PAP2 family protein [Bacteroidota bacterium]
MFESFDISLLKIINLGRITGLDGLFIFITNSGPIIAGLIPLAFIATGLYRRKKEFWVTGLQIASPYLLAVITSNLLKIIIARPRPATLYPFIQKLSAGGSGSFPSGHTSDAFSVAMALSLLFPKRWVVIPLFCWAFLVGYSRMDLGVHYPTDVLGGAMIGLLSALLCYRFFRYRERSNKDEEAETVMAPAEDQ